MHGGDSAIPLRDRGSFHNEVLLLPSYGKKTGAGVVFEWTLSDSDPQRSYFQELMSEDFSVVGVGCGEHLVDGTMCAIVLAGGYTEASAEQMEVAEIDFSDVRSLSKSSEPIPVRVPVEVADIDFATLEREIVAEVNRARSHPEEYAVYLEQRRRYYNDYILRVPGYPSMQTQEGVEAVDEALEFLRNVQPLSEMDYSEGMSAAAREQAYCLRNQQLTHVGCDGSTIEERLQRHGELGLPAGENLAVGSQTGREFVLQWIVDDGIHDRGHRHNIFNPEYKVTGVSCLAHRQHRIICAAEYAANYRNN